MSRAEKYGSLDDNLRPVVLDAGWYYPGILKKKRPSRVPEINEPLPDRKVALAIIHRAEARNRKSGKRAFVVAPPRKEQGND